MFPKFQGTALEKLHIFVQAGSFHKYPQWIHLDPIRDVSYISSQLRHFEIKVIEKHRQSLELPHNSFELSLLQEIERIGKGLAGMNLTTTKEIRGRHDPSSPYSRGCEVFGLTWRFIFMRI